MLVKATARGYYYWVRQPDEVFEIPDRLFSDAWMEKVDPPPPPAEEPISAADIVAAQATQPTGE
jgi:hypothetical protein